MPSKTCFVTIGATASFSSLVQAVLAPSCLEALERLGYTQLLIQYGEAGKPIFDRAVLDSQRDGQTSKLEITGFDLDRAGLSTQMREVKGKGSADAAIEGVVISHAGSGTVLDALRIAVPIIVVPNTDLLDNHQLELAEALAEQGYVVHGKLHNLPQALEEAENLRARSQAWPPVNSVSNGKVGGLTAVLDDEMGFLD